MRIGSLCTGTSALDMAVQSVLGGELAWVADPDPGATALLAHHHPEVPNLGDITATDWTTVEPVDVLCAGFPCQDISYAGRGEGIQNEMVIPAGLMPCGCQWADHNADACEAASPSGVVPSRTAEQDQADHAVAELNELDRSDPAGPPPERIVQRRNRSGLWHTIADALAVLRPRLVVLENVAAIIGRRPGFDVVLADLAALGFDAEWTCVRASDIGAPHRRERWFLVAYPNDLGDDRCGRFGRPAERHTPSADRHAANAQGTRWEGQGDQRGRSGRRHPTPADAAGDGRDERRPESEGQQGRHDVAVCGGVATDPEGERYGNGWQTRIGGLEAASVPGSPTDPARFGDQNGTQCDHGQFVGAQPGSGAGDSSRPGAPRAGRTGDDPGVLAWGPYGPAIDRWAAVLGRPAPNPVGPTATGSQGLSPHFVEWVMGLPEGWITGVPGITRNQMLKLGGNGVVPQQGAAALALLLGRMDWAEAAA